MYSLLGYAITSNGCCVINSMTLFSFGPPPPPPLSALPPLPLMEDRKGGGGGVVGQPGMYEFVSIFVNVGRLQVVYLGVFDYGFIRHIFRRI